MIFGINTTRDISLVSKLTHLMAREISYNNFEISLVVFMPNITTNHAITYTYNYMSEIRIPCCYRRNQFLSNDTYQINLIFSNRATILLI